MVSKNSIVQTPNIETVQVLFRRTVFKEKEARDLIKQLMLSKICWGFRATLSRLNPLKKLREGDQLLLPLRGQIVFSNLQDSLQQK